VASLEAPKDVVMLKQLAMLVMFCDNLLTLSKCSTIVMLTQLTLLVSLVMEP